MQTLLSTLSRFRWYFINLLSYAQNRRHRRRESSKPVLFDIQDNQFHRYLTIFMHFLEIEGYSIHIRWRNGLLTSWATRELFRQIKGIKLYRSDSKIPNQGWVFSDRHLAPPSVRLDPDYFSEDPDPMSTYKLPMPMVDTFYMDRTHDRPALDPTLTRERGVFFFGNMDPNHYDRPEIAEAFGCLTRAALLGTLRKELPHMVKEPTTIENAHVEGSRMILVMDRRNRYIRPDELRPVLERFDFFLALPGVVMPLCHNLIEAMSVGCIPIIQYAHLLDPPLRHTHDCLSFSSAEQLIELLNQLTDMSALDIQQMRGNVTSYFHKHLTPSAVIGELERRGDGLKRIKMNAEWPSTELLLTRQRSERTA